MGHRARFAALTGLVPCILSGCGPDIPEECGQNVAEVTRIEFSGPSEVDEDGAGYTVTIGIERTNGEGPAIVCYAVRDDDGVFNVDDVLAANFMIFTGTAETKTEAGAFSLLDGNGELCGFGIVADENGCAGESETGVYLDVIGSDGDDSAKRSEERR